MFRILVINPGSTSTKLALFEDETAVWIKKISYSLNRLSGFEDAMDQYAMRLKDLEKAVADKETDLSIISAVVSRGGPFKPLNSGTYKVSSKVLEDVRNGNVQADHISNLGIFLAHHLAKKAKVPAFFVDPVSVDEFENIARISGIPELERKSLLHALNIKSVARRAAKEIGFPLQKLNLIVAHLGGGISVCPICKGRIVDVNNANEGGPFSPERSGSLPVSSLAKLCYSGKFSYDEMKKRLTGQGGMAAYLGTNDMGEVEKRIHRGDKEARLIVEAMAYQIAKEIGAMAAVLRGTINAIILTGGLAHSDLLTQWIFDRIDFLAPVKVYPGEDEMKSLCFGVLRVLRGEEKVKKY